MTRVLITDRDESIASLLATTVCRLVDCDVTLAHTPDEAARVLQSETFDLVLLDLSMYSEGLETLRHMRGRNENCEIIAFTTGLITGPLLKTLAESEVFAVVTKPFDMNQLSTVVSDCLRSRLAESNRPLVYRRPGSEPTHE